MDVICENQQRRKGIETGMETNLNVIDEVELAEVALDIVLNEHRLHNLLGGEAVNLHRKFQVRDCARSDAGLLCPTIKWTSSGAYMMYASGGPHLAVGDGAHERRLAAAIVAADAVALATLEMEAGVVEENLQKAGGPGSAVSHAPEVRMMGQSGNPRAVAMRTLAP
jgi:hypothetical protein